MNDTTSIDETWTTYLGLVADILGDMLDEPDLSIGTDAHLVHDIGLDSFGVLAFVAELEDRLDVLLPAAEDEPTLSTIYRTLQVAGPGRAGLAGRLVREAGR